jgi:hypothetical protein
MDHGASTRRLGEYQVTTRLCTRSMGNRVRRLRARCDGRCDLRAYASAVALVEVDQAIEAKVVGCARVHCNEALGKVDPTKPRKIHRKEGDVGANISHAIAVIELDAIDNLEVVTITGMKEHVLEAEITVSVTDGPLDHPLFEQITMSTQEGALPSLDLGHRLARYEVAIRLLQTGEIVDHIA